MNPILSYNEYSKTIRQLPENYLIAHKDGNKWICEPDLAANKELCARVFLELMNFESKYETNGLALLAKLTPNSESAFTQALTSVNKYFIDLQNKCALTPHEENVWAKVSKALFA